MLRREFLRRGLAAGILLVRPHTARAATAAEPALARLAAGLRGRLIVPADRGYDAARRLFNARFDPVFPLGMAYCEDSEDVLVCLQWARREHAAVAVRCGGHSAAGYSTTPGLVIDVSRMNRIAGDAGRRQAVIEAGATLGAVYPALLGRGLTIPGGTCPGVGIGGLTLGGGIGYLTNLLGTASDNLLSLEMVTAGGEILECDESRNADLFWAARGGGGGNFGVATRFTFRARPVQRASYARHVWDLRDARAVVDAWQRWAPDIDARLTSTCEATATARPGPESAVTVTTLFDGPQAELSRRLEPFLHTARARPRRQLLSEGPYGDAVRFWLAREAPASQRATVKNKTDFITEPLPAKAIDILARWLVARGANGALASAGSVWMQALGGRYRHFAKDATAYVHRDARVLVQYSTHWAAGGIPATAQEHFRWINGFYAAMRPYASGEAYQNFMDPDLPNWPRAYYGSNLERLSRIKRDRDPDNVFHFEQSIPEA